MHARVAQLVEHTLGKGEVTGSIPVSSSNLYRPSTAAGGTNLKKAEAG